MDELENQNPVQATEQAPAQPSYRDKMLGRIKSVKPDYEPVDDEDMLRELEDLYTEKESKLGEMEGIAESITELTARDPKFAAIIEIMRDPENPRTFGYAFAKVYGRDFLDADDEEIEAGELEYQENIGKMKQAQAAAQKNFAESMAHLDQVVSENGLEEAQKSEIYNKLLEKAENYLNGVIPYEEIDDIRKALYYDKDLQDAADAGLAQGKSMRVDEKLQKAAPMPDMGSTTGAGKGLQTLPGRVSPLDKFRNAKV